MSSAMNQAGQGMLEQVKNLIMNGSVDEVQAFIKLLDPKGKIAGKVRDIAPADIRLAHACLFMDCLGETADFMVDDVGLNRTEEFVVLQKQISHLLNKYEGKYLSKAQNTPMAMWDQVKTTVQASDLDRMTRKNELEDDSFCEKDIPLEDIELLPPGMYKKIVSDAAEEARENLIFKPSRVWKLVETKVKRALVHQDQLRIYETRIKCFVDCFVRNPHWLERLQENDASLFTYDTQWEEKQKTDPNVVEPIKLFHPKRMGKIVDADKGAKTPRGYPVKIEEMVVFIRTVEKAASKMLEDPTLSEEKRAKLLRKQDAWTNLLRKLNNLAMLSLLYTKVDDESIVKLLKSFVGVMDEFLDGSMFKQVDATKITNQTDALVEQKKRGFDAVPERILREIQQKMPEFQHLLGDLKLIVMEIVFHNTSIIRETFDKVMSNIPKECSDLLESLKIKIQQTQVQSYMTDRWNHLLEERGKSRQQSKGAPSNEKESARVSQTQI